MVSVFLPWWVWCWGALLPGRSAVSRWVGVLVLISTGDVGDQPGQGRNKDEPADPANPGGQVFCTALPGVGFFGWFLPGVLFAAVSFFCVPPGGFGGRGPSFRGWSMVSRWVGVPVLIPTGECRATTPTRPGAHQRRTHRASQTGEARLLNRPFGGWLSWLVSSRGSFRGGFVFLRFFPGGFGVGVLSFLVRSVVSRWLGELVLTPTGECWTPRPTRPGTM